MRSPPRKNWARARASFRCRASSGSSAQSDEYREEVLPNECRRRVAIEAGVPEIWYQYVGLDGKVIGLHRFGLSAPGAEVMKEFGIDAQHVIDAARSLSKRRSRRSEPGLAYRRAVTVTRRDLERLFGSRYVRARDLRSG